MAFSLSMDFVEDGFAVLPSALSGSQYESAVRSIQGASDDRVGSRALLSEAWCRALAQSLRLHRALARLLAGECRRRAVHAVREVTAKELASHSTRCAACPALRVRATPVAGGIGVERGHLTQWLYERVFERAMGPRVRD